MSQAAINPERSAPANRLSIAHLLLWMAGTAMVIVCMERIWRFELHLIPPNAPSLDSVIGYDGPAFAEAEYRAKFRKQLRIEIKLACVALAFSPIYGAAIALAGITVRRLAIRPIGWSAQPGHWLAIVITSIIATIGWGLVFDWNNTFNYDVSGLCLFGFPGIALFGAAVYLRDSRLWRTAFVTGGAGFFGLAWVYWLEAFRSGPLPPDLIEVLHASPALLVIAGAVTLSIAVLLDLKARTQRDALHWIGVVVMLLTLAHPLVAMIVGSWS